jgi:hypothetical protein
MDINVLGCCRALPTRNRGIKSTRAPRSHTVGDFINPALAANARAGTGTGREQQLTLARLYRHFVAPSTIWHSLL